MLAHANLHGAFFDVSDFHAGCRMSCALGCYSNGCHVVSKFLCNSCNLFQRFAGSSCCTSNLIQRHAANQTTTILSIFTRSISNVLLSYNLHNINAQLFNLLHGQIAGQHIACMVQHNKEYTVAFVCHFNCLYTSLRARCSKNIASNRNINHTFANKAADSRLMASAAQGYDGYAVCLCQFFVHNEVTLLQGDNVRVR